MGVAQITNKNECRAKILYKLLDKFKMLCITYYQGNFNQNNDEISLHTSNSDTQKMNKNNHFWHGYR